LAEIIHDSEFTSSQTNFFIKNASQMIDQEEN